MAAMSANSLLRLQRRIATIWGKISKRSKSFFDYISLPDFASCPTKCKIVSPRQILEPQRITLGENIYIGPNSALVVLPDQDLECQPDQRNPRLIIGNGVWATSELQIYALREIIIGDDVLFGKNVFIADGLHRFQNVTVPYKDQGFWRIAPVKIGRGSWIGQNVVINPGVTIGEFCVIGGNSVVTKSIPDRCIAVGAPAKIIKQWNEEAEDWSTFTKPTLSE